ncbi:hypothetical protein [Gordonia sp. MMO-8]|uniref:hypothetical protein n=1 Tax=Gordonia sp. MMO-8 TaxID=3127886 RepID=UPI0030187EB3
MEFKQSAHRHGITVTEIEIVVAYPLVRVALAARQADALPVLHIGAAGENEPHIEVIIDVAPVVPVVFHAMMLRPSTVANNGIGDHFRPNYSRQRR